MERPAHRKVEQRRRAEQTRSEIGSLAYGVVHFITRDVEATVHRADADQWCRVFGTVTTDDGGPAVPAGSARKKDDIITLRSNLVDASALVDHCRGQSKLSHDGYGLLEDYQREVKEVLDRYMFRP